MTTPSPTLDLEPVRACFADALSEHKLLAQSVEHTLSQLEGLRSKLAVWQRELDRRFAELEEKKHAVSVTQAEENAQRDVEQREEIQRLRDRCAELQESLTQQEREVEYLKSAMESAVQCDAETAELRTQLDNALTEATAAGKAAAAQKEQFRNLQQDRAVLEAELELVRSRAADLSETLSREREQISEDRAVWATELKQLRRVIERKTAVASATLVTPPVRAASTGGGDKELVTVCDSRADPIVGSVLAQFDKIRQQRAAGRANRN